MKRMTMILVILACQLMTFEAFAQKHYGSMEALRGVDGFFIVIENMPEDFEKMGLPQRDLQAGIAKRLSQAGISVHSEKTNSSSASYMYVNLSGFAAKEGIVVYNVMVRINQSVIPAHNRSIMIDGGIWYLSQIGTLPLDGAVDGLQKQVGELVDGFISDYHAVNPE